MNTSNGGDSEDRIAKPPVGTCSIAIDTRPHAKRKFKRPDWVPPAQPGGAAAGSQPPKRQRRPEAAKDL